MDPVTGLRRYDLFVRDLRDAIVRVRDADGCVTIALLDLDGFGAINRVIGDAEGDKLIAAFADSLGRVLSASGELYRYGGDALMVLFRGLDKEEAFMAIEHARHEYERESKGPVKGGPPDTMGLTFSGGVASAPDDGTEVRRVLRRCHEALYRAKVRGPNKVCLAREEKMVTKTTHYTQGQLAGLARLARRENVNEASLLREALDDLLRKHNS
jgi:diguanylate cyclase (GGDEF)-like protein